MSSKMVENQRLIVRFNRDLIVKMSNFSNARNNRKQNAQVRSLEHSKSIICEPLASIFNQRLTICRDDLIRTKIDDKMATQSHD